MNEIQRTICSCRHKEFQLTIFKCQQSISDTESAIREFEKETNVILRGAREKVYTDRNDLSLFNLMNELKHIDLGKKLNKTLIEPLHDIIYEAVIVEKKDIVKCKDCENWKD